MKTIVFGFGVLMILSCGGTTKDKKVASEKEAYEQQKESLEEKEKKNPSQFLTVALKVDRKNLIGQTVVKGEVNNRATVAAYKDIEVEMSYFSKTKALLGKDVEVIYEIIEPGKSVSFKSKNFAPKGTEEIQLSVTAAKNN